MTWPRYLALAGDHRVGSRRLSRPHRVPRLAPLHQLLQPMAGCAHVAQCAEAVPTLLLVFFSAVTQVSPLPGAPLFPQLRGKPEPASGVLLSSAEGSSYHTHRPRPHATALAGPVPRAGRPHPSCPVPAGPVPLSR
ncbi:AP-5 complex subunit zeta-1 [Plecturocebus cupreus]